MNIEKDWGLIAEAKDPQLRALLIAAKGEIAESMRKGFPEYFIPDGEQYARPDKAAFLAQVSNKKKHEVIQECAGLPFQIYGFSQVYHFAPKQKSGEIIQHEGAEWLVVWKGFTEASGEEISGHYSAVIVPIEAFA